MTHKKVETGGSSNIYIIYYSICSARIFLYYRRIKMSSSRNLSLESILRPREKQKTQFSHIHL